MNDVQWEKYGLSESNGNCILDILSRFSAVQEVILFGSRAKGNYKSGSDIDLAIKGDITKDVLSTLLAVFEDSLLPYFVDVVVYGHLKNEALIEHIDRVGETIYRRL